MRTTIAAISLAFFTLPGAWAAGVPEEPTFNRDVLPILQANCQNCHRPKPVNISGMVAPFALTSYDEARPWAKSIARAVESKTMPPWFATEEFHGVFRNERGLTADEIATITGWVKAGAPRGAEEDAPPPLVFEDSKWWLGEPDLIVNLPEPVWVGDDVVDWQPNIMIELTEEMLPKDRYLRAVECQPNSEGVHHIVLSALPPGGADGLTAAAGGKGIGGLAPGSEPSLALPGYGIKLEKGSTIRANMHYFKEPGPGTGFYNQASIGLYFYPEGEEVVETRTDPLGTLDFEIPPGQESWEVGVARTFDRDFALMGFLPHMHLRGIAAEYEAHLPDGTVEKLLDVPRYDYNWQVDYEYPAPRTYPAGTRIEARMTFDNSANNPSNPDPNKAIGFGLETVNEMVFGFVRYVWQDDMNAGAAGTGGGR